MNAVDVVQLYTAVSVRRHGVRGFYLSNPLFHRVLHFSEGAYLDLPHPLARYAELLGKFFQREGVIS